MPPILQGDGGIEIREDWYYSSLEIRWENMLTLWQYLTKPNLT